MGETELNREIGKHPSRRLGEIVQVKEKLGISAIGIMVISKAPDFQERCLQRVEGA